MLTKEEQLGFSLKASVDTAIEDRADRVAGFIMIKLLLIYPSFILSSTLLFDVIMTLA